MQLGLATFAQRAGQYARILSTRLVDAKAQGIATKLDALTADIFRLPDSQRVDVLIERLAGLALIAAAYRRQDELPAPLDAGQWLEGFLGTTGHTLLHDKTLRAIIDGWMCALGADDFMVVLAKLRRAFGTLDKMERCRLLDDIRRTVVGASVPVTVAPQTAHDIGAPGFAAAVPLLLKILGIAPKGPNS